MVCSVTGRSATTSPALAASALSLAQVCKDYIGVLNEESLRKNFTLIYELADGRPRLCRVRDTSNTCQGHAP